MESWKLVPILQIKNEGCTYELAVFTNLTQDHLDYHKDMDDYFEAKALLFSSDYLKGRAIVNADDPYGKQLIARIESEKVWSYSASDAAADLWTSDLEYKPTGVKGMLHTPQGEIPFSLSLIHI